MNEENPRQGVGLAYLIGIGGSLIIVGLLSWANQGPSMPWISFGVEVPQEQRITASNNTLARLITLLPFARTRWDIQSCVRDQL